MDQEIEQVCVKPDVALLELEIKIENDVEPNDESGTVFRIKKSDENCNQEDEDLTSKSKDQISVKKNNKICGKVYENGKINRIGCPQCDNTFKNRANLKRHLKFVHPTDDDVVECPQCYRTFKSLSHLRSHTSSVHAVEEEVICDICKKTFLNKRRLKNHIFFTHPEPKESVTCEQCNKVFKRKYNLKVHMRQVHPSKDKSVKCLQCDKMFKTDMLLQRHMNWSHPADGMMYRCQHCGRVLPSIGCYKKHIQNVHSEIQNKICKICLKSYKTIETLRTHERNVHGEVKVKPKQYQLGDLKCSDCDKRFTTKTALFWHYERCHSENKRSTSCSECKKEFSDYAGLKRHVESSHSLDPVTCNTCQKTFKTPKNLVRHIRITHAPPEAAKTCEICQKSFKCMVHLRIHKHTVHPKPGSFKCDVCTKEFSSKRYLVKHEKTHDNSKRVPCLICGKLYKTQGDVTKHCKREHDVRITSLNE